MKPHMLQSQYEALEEPTNALTVEISKSLNAITQEIIMQYRLQHKAIDKSQRKGTNS
jgi:gluconate kinase